MFVIGPRSKRRRLHGGYRCDAAVSART
jgi:hypothetical protein